MDLASWHPSDWLTAGLVFFASVQVAVMWWTEGRRSRERHEDRLREIDRAIVTLRAESFRAFTVTRRWKNVDLFQEAVAGVLQPEEILPVDFPSVVAAGSALGPAAANICLAGLQLLEDASKLVRNFTQYASMIGGAIRYTHLGIMPPNLREDAEKRIRDLIWVAEEAVRTLEDAAEQSPRAQVPLDLRIMTGAKSDVARRLAGLYGTRPRFGESGWAQDSDWTEST